MVTRTSGDWEQALKARCNWRLGSRDLPSPFNHNAPSHHHRSTRLSAKCWRLNQKHMIDKDKSRRVAQNKTLTKIRKCIDKLTSGKLIIKNIRNEFCHIDAPMKSVMRTLMQVGKKVNQSIKDQSARRRGLLIGPQKCCLRRFTLSMA